MRTSCRMNGNPGVFPRSCVLSLPALALLAVLAMCTGICFAREQTASTSAPAGRVLHFPKDRSVGLLKIQDVDVPEPVCKLADEFFKIRVFHAVCLNGARARVLVRIRSNHPMFTQDYGRSLIELIERSDTTNVQCSVINMQLSRLCRVRLRNPIAGPEPGDIGNALEMLPAAVAVSLPRVSHTEHREPRNHQCRIPSGSWVSVSRGNRFPPL